MSVNINSFAQTHRQVAIDLDQLSAATKDELAAAGIPASKLQATAHAARGYLDAKDIFKLASNGQRVIYDDDARGQQILQIFAATLARGEAVLRLDGEALRTDFVAAGKVVNLSTLNAAERHALKQAGVKPGQGEITMEEAWKLIDEPDTDGNRASIVTSYGGQQTPAGTVFEILSKHIASASQPAAPEVELGDNALRRCFTRADLKIGAGHDDPVQTAAVQYTLARLGYRTETIDGDAESSLARQIRAFHEDQAAAGRPHRGDPEVFDLESAKIAQAALAALPPVPALASGMAPMEFIDAEIAKLPSVADKITPPASWSDKAVQAAYDQLLPAIWEITKTNNVETDCKSLAIYFARRFVNKVKHDFGRPVLSAPKGLGGQHGGFNRAEVVGTPKKTLGLFVNAGTFERSDRALRSDYSDLYQLMHRVDPEAATVQGVNVRYNQISANYVGRQISRKATFTAPQANGLMVDIDQVAPGDIIAIDHERGADRDHWGHVVNVVAVEEHDGVKRITLAVGSYNNMRAAGERAGGLADINPYCNEVVLEFDANGECIRDEVTWGSEQPNAAWGTWNYGRWGTLGHDGDRKAVVGRFR